MIVLELVVDDYVSIASQLRRGRVSLLNATAVMFNLPLVTKAT